MSNSLINNIDLTKINNHIAYGDDANQFKGG